VLINAAAALIAAEKAKNFQEGISLAESAIDEGSAMKKLDALIAFTRENG
jgi:anthranilate phosphoribosyltransferase